MYIKSLKVNNFRNYLNENISLCPHTNVFYGDNAQGKTNILEAVYLFSCGKSQRTKTDSELVSFGQIIASVDIVFSDTSRDYHAVMRISKDGKKQIKINNVPIKKLSMLMSYLNVVMFSPRDLEMIKGSPSSRRQFIDEAISQLYPNYLSKLINYNKTIYQKNSLLRQLKFSGKTDDDTLSIWNDRLAEYGAVIYKYRKEFLNEISDIAKPIHKDITGEDFEISYIPGIKISDEQSLRDSFFASLEHNKKREIDLASSLVGIQRDDFKVCVDGKEAKIFGSQGQQRTCVLTLKMAQTEYIKNIKEEYPVLLLDDIMSELDINRRKYLWERIGDKQVLITCTDTDNVMKNSDTKYFNVKKGHIIV